MRSVLASLLALGLMVALFAPANAAPGASPQGIEATPAGGP